MNVVNSSQKLLKIKAAKLFVVSRLKLGNIVKKCAAGDLLHHQERDYSLEMRLQISLLASRVLKNQTNQARMFAQSLVYSNFVGEILLCDFQGLIFEGFDGVVFLLIIYMSRVPAISLTSLAKDKLAVISFVKYISTRIVWGFDHIFD